MGLIVFTMVLIQQQAVPPTATWILWDGIWHDDLLWDDNETWID